MKKFTFFSPHLSLRGTEVALFDYAFYGRKFFDWDVQILYNKNEERNHPTTIEKFEKEFEVYSVDATPKNLIETNAQIEKFLEKNPSEFFYIQKGGKRDGICPSNSKVCVLCCGEVNPFEEKHGHSYAFVSDWLAKTCSNGEFPVVPPIVDLPDVNEDMRKDLNIPKDSTVFGRTGGMDTWNIPFTNSVIQYILENINPKPFFLFQNTPNFYEHPNIIHLPKTSDLTFKTKFINTCDALLHSRLEGESFGSTCGEFSIRNKRVITFRDSRERNHINILQEKGIYYSSAQELFDILTNFTVEEGDWNCYREFEPHKVMEIFNKIFVQQKV